MADVQRDRSRRSIAGRAEGFYRDSREAWDVRGFAGLLQEWREALVFPVFRHGRLLIVEQHLETVTAVPAPAGVTIAIMPSDGDWATFTAIAKRREIRRMRRAAERGRTCLAASRGEERIGYTWISDRIEIDVESFPVPLPPHAAYGWNLYVSPAERSAGVGTALVAGRLCLARERGFRSMWRVIDITNRPTLRTLEKTWGRGSRIVGELRYVKVLGWARGRVGTVTDTVRFRPPEG